MRNIIWPFMLLVGLVGYNYAQAAQQLDVRFDTVNIPLQQAFNNQGPNGQIKATIINPTGYPFAASEALLQLYIGNNLLGTIHLPHAISIPANTNTPLSLPLYAPAGTIVANWLQLIGSGNLNQNLTVSGFVRFGPIKYPISELIPIQKLLTSWQS